MGFVKLQGIDTMFAEIGRQLAEAEDLVVERLQYIGERAVKEARAKGAYTDRTGNLRSSIGYVILKDGIRIGESAPEHFGEGDEGVQKMHKLLAKLQSEFPKGYALIVCAGMEYASYVEDIHDLDVLTSARLLADQLIRKFL